MGFGGRAMYEPSAARLGAAYSSVVWAAFQASGVARWWITATVSPSGILGQFYVVICVTRLHHIGHSEGGAMARCRAASSVAE